MTQIYPSAERVLVWLGDDENGSAGTAFDVLRQWYEASEPGQERLRVRLMKRIDSRELEALGTLFAHSWWRRAWTLQEVNVDYHTPPDIVCGRHKLSWKVFCHAFLTIFTSFSTNEATTTFSDNSRYILPMLNTSWSPKSDHSLSFLVPVVASREATLEQDKLFSLLGMIGPQSLRYPVPDYRWTVEEACTIYTRAIIEVEQNLDILLSVSPSLPEGILPSWAIKLDRMRGDYNRLEKNDVTREYRYGACPSQPPMLAAAEGQFDTRLRLSGLTVDRVASIRQAGDFLSTAFLKQRPHTWLGMLETLRRCGENLGFQGTYTPSKQPVVEVMFRTLCAEDFFLMKPDHRWYFTAIQRLHSVYTRHVSRGSPDSAVSFGRSRDVLDADQLVKYVCEHFPMSDAQASAGTTMRQARNTSKVTHSDRSLPVSFIDRAMCDAYLEAVHDTLNNRSLLITKRGRIGLAPIGAKAGDEVCLLPGASVPILLRATKSRDGSSAHQLVGEAYVHGIMYGEGMEAYEAKRAKSGVERASQKFLTQFCIV